MKKEELINPLTTKIVASILLCIPFLVTGQESVSYTQAQADAGQQTYEQRCASCHGFNLEGFELAPALIGNCLLEDLVVAVQTTWRATYCACRQTK